MRQILLLCALVPCLLTTAPGGNAPPSKIVPEVLGNIRAAQLPRLSPELHDRLSEFYESRVKAHIRGPY